MPAMYDSRLDLLTRLLQPPLLSHSRHDLVVLPE